MIPCVPWLPGLGSEHHGQNQRFPCVGGNLFCAGRSGCPDRLRAQVSSLCESPIAAFLLSSLHGYVAILNEQRQILAASPDLLGALGPRWDGDCTGARWGEAFECIHVAEGPDGCGTSKACRQCGSALAVLSAQSKTGPVEGECEISMRREGVWQAVEFHVTASPLQVGPHRFTTMVFRDISPEKRREAMEQLFFHDIDNILQGLQGWAESLGEGWCSPEEAARKILLISVRLSSEIHSHRRLVHAERGQLKACPAPVDGGHILRELAAHASQHPASQRRSLDLEMSNSSGQFTSDPDLLLRVLYNMAINAYEASESGGPVRATFGWRGNCPHFSIHNEGVIPEAMRTRIFHRSFSTKAAQGRGLGTHAMKLFGENLLKGKVGFDTSAEAGTTFWILLPPELGEK